LVGLHRIAIINKEEILKKPALLNYVMALSMALKFEQTLITLSLRKHQCINLIKMKL
jgi:hypothetical protein